MESYEHPERSQLSTVTIQPCIVDGCGNVRLADQELELPFGICENHLNKLRSEIDSYGVVCMHCRALAYIARMPDRPKRGSDITEQLLFVHRCADCGGIMDNPRLWTWTELQRQEDRRTTDNDQTDLRNT